jgi:hypothetical protein
MNGYRPYKIVAGTYSREIVDKVNDLLAQGWECYGPLVTRPADNVEGMECYASVLQVMRGPVEPRPGFKKEK